MELRYSVLTPCAAIKRAFWQPDVMFLWNVTATSSAPGTRTFLIVDQRLPMNSGGLVSVCVFMQKDRFPTVRIADTAHIEFGLTHNDHNVIFSNPLLSSQGSQGVIFFKILLATYFPWCQNCPTLHRGTKGLKWGPQALRDLLKEI